MASPATTHTVRPLDGLCLETVPGPGTETAAALLRQLGARPGDGAAPAAERAGTAGTEGRTVLAGAGLGTVSARTTWGEGPAEGPGTALCDEATVQAATGIMAVHGRRDGAPRGLGADYAETAAAVLAVQGLLARLVGRARGGTGTEVRTSAARAGLLAVSQYLAAEGADEAEAADIAPGGPPFRSAEGTLFELETLQPAAWAAFWRELGAPEKAIRAGWRPFQFRYATACAPFPHALHTTASTTPWARIRAAADRSGAQVCALRTLAGRDIPEGPAVLLEPGPGPADPWPGGAPGEGAPLAGLTVLEAGRRIQAPLAAHLLGLLGARVIRIEPPGGDPLRGMPPACSGISARWLALNRGKEAVEADITTPAGRRAVLELASGAEVFLHNWAPGKAAALGLDHGDLAGARPGLVYAYTGGWAGRLPDAPMGTDFMVQARTGVGEAVRPSDEPPAPSLMTLLDVLGGLLGTQAVLAGLLLRERGGTGVRVESSLLGAADLLTAAARDRLRRGRDPRPPAGFRRPLRTTDGWVAAADLSAAAARAYDLAHLTTAEAVALLRSHGLAATAVTHELGALPTDPRLPGPVGRDAHGALAVPRPWSL
ncbi:CoA transferase [Streptomyces sp. NPDC097619]|uniref:CoA transferase n=1 Tax=Streptomyces sp. NPDC097619 TaxID=3157228 RepID=UPI0033212A96